MSTLVPSINQKTEILDDAVTLFVNNKVYEGWKDMQLERELNVIASPFSLSATEKWSADGTPWRIKPNDHSHIHIGKTAMHTGFVDTMELDFDVDSRVTKISGRSRTGDLVDCSVVGQNEYRNLFINDIAAKLCEPFGIRVLLRSSAGEKISKFTIKQGESVYEALDRLARQRSLILYPSYEGNLIMERKGNVVASGELVQGQNVLRGSSTYDNSERYSRYIVKGQNPGSISGLPSQNAAAIGEATDGGIRRNRPLIVIAENAVDNASAKERAKYEANIRLARSLSVNLEVQGWYQKDGKPWEINQLIFVNVPYLGIRNKLLCKKVKFTKGSDGTKCNIELIHPDAFEFEKEEVVETEDDLIARLGQVNQ